MSDPLDEREAGVLRRVFDRLAEIHDESSDPRVDKGPYDSAGYLRARLSLYRRELLDRVRELSREASDD